MAENSKIEWTDHTASPWHGCSEAVVNGQEHPGCMNCYAKRMAKRNPGTLGVWGPDGVRIKSKSFLSNLEKWNRLGEKLQRVQSVFPSICDPFEDFAGLEPWRRELFEAIDHLTWVRLLLLTKRPENVRRMWPMVSPPILPDVDHGKWFRSNVWIGSSISDQPTADVIVPNLLKCHGLTPVKFLSVEPMLGPMKNLLSHMLCRDCVTDLPASTYDRTPDPCDGSCPRIDWVIIGTESGPHRRPIKLEWAESLVDQCRDAGVACFVKQLEIDGKVTTDVERFPPSLRVREFPEVES